MNKINNITVSDEIYNGSRAIEGSASNSGLAGLKKLRTSDEKSKKLRNWKFKLEPVATPSVEDPYIKQVEEEVPDKVELPPKEVVLDPIPVAEMPKVEIEEPEVKIYEPSRTEVVEPAVREPSLFDTRNYGITPPTGEKEEPVYSFDASPRTETSYTGNKLTNVGGTIFNSMKTTEDLKKEKDRAEGPIEASTLEEGIEKSKEIDREKEYLQKELKDIIEEEAKIKEAKKNKQEEIKACDEKRVGLNEELREKVTAAKEYDRTVLGRERTLKIYNEKEEDLAKQKNADIEAFNKKLEELRSKVIANVAPEPELTPVAIANRLLNEGVSTNSIPEYKDPDFDFNLPKPKVR